MLLTITISVLLLVALNLILLRFTCNLTNKPAKISKTPIVLTHRITIEEAEEVLAPTGS